MAVEHMGIDDARVKCQLGLREIPGIACAETRRAVGEYSTVLSESEALRSRPASPLARF